MKIPGKLRSLLQIAYGVSLAARVRVFARPETFQDYIEIVMAKYWPKRTGFRHEVVVLTTVKIAIEYLDYENLVKIANRLVKERSFALIEGRADFLCAVAAAAMWEKDRPLSMRAIRRLSFNGYCDDIKLLKLRAMGGVRFGRRLQEDQLLMLAQSEDQEFFYFGPLEFSIKAMALERVGRLSDALSLYKKSLRSMPDGQDRRKIEKAIRELEDRTAWAHPANK